MQASEIEAVEGNQTQNTLYMLCSISKLFVVACVGILVDEGKLDWNRPVSKFLPGFTTPNNLDISRTATFVDVLRHTAGLSNPVVSILGPHGKIVLPEDDFLEAVEDAPTGDITWEYSNIGYGVIAMAIQHVSGTRYAQFLKERILEPLGMRHTAVTEEEVRTSTNIAAPYVQLETGEWESLEYEWTTEKNTPVLAAFGMRSSMKDLLIFCAATMAAEQAENGTVSQNPDILKNITLNPLKQVNGMRNGAYWTRPHDDRFQTTSQFHLGWMKAAIPSCQISWASYNGLTWDDDNRTGFKYILGQDSGQNEIEFLKHTGLGFGSSLAVFTFPGTSSAVVVLCNGLNVGDAADFVSQVFIQELFELKPHQDILPWVKLETERRHQEFYNTIMRGWLENRKVSDPEACPGDYIGDYRGLGITVSIHQDRQTSKLRVELNREDLSITLEFYSQDRYSYLPTTRDDWLRGGWLDWDNYAVGILDFTRGASGKVDGFNWQWDEFQQPSKFRRISETPHSRRVTGGGSVKDHLRDGVDQKAGTHSSGNPVSHKKLQDNERLDGVPVNENEERSRGQNGVWRLPWWGPARTRSIHGSVQPTGICNTKLPLPSSPSPSIISTTTIAIN